MIMIYTQTLLFYIYSTVNLTIVFVIYGTFLGATLGKGLNRTIATLAAGALGVGAHYLASLSGATGEPILIGAFVFVQGENKLYT